jgi:DnaJ-class molecular chaperone
MPDPYQVLGLDSTATKEEAQKAFRNLAKKYHPDKSATLSEEAQQEAEAKFKEINEANEQIQNPEPNHDILNNSFWKPPIQPIQEVHFVNVSLKDAYHEKTIAYQYYQYNKDQVKRCDTCGGTGTIETREQHGQMIAISQKPCSGCNGRKIKKTGTPKKVDLEIHLQNNLPAHLNLGLIGSYDPNFDRPAQLIIQFQYSHDEEKYPYEIRNGNIITSKDIKVSEWLEGASHTVSIFDKQFEVKLKARKDLQKLSKLQGQGFAGRDVLIQFKIMANDKLASDALLKMLKEEGL